MVVVGGVEWWNSREVAEHITSDPEKPVKPATVLGYNRKGQMPKGTKFGRSPMWERTVIEAWHAGRRGPGWRKGQTEA